LAACAAAAVGLTVTTATSTSAEELSTPVRNDSGLLLGRGCFDPEHEVDLGSGSITVYDTYCDGDNRIIAGLYVVWNGEWTRSGLVSVRGCRSSKSNGLIHNSSRPAYGEYVRFRVCKLTPGGTWKDCKDRFTFNDDIPRARP
jgi:hypothetical protein